MRYLKNSDKVIGFYCWEEKDNNGLPYKLYCYVVEDRYGEKTCNFTTDKDEYEEAFLVYLKKNGYDINNVDNVWTDDLDKVNLSCKDDKDVFDRIKRSTQDKDMEYDDFLDAKEDYLEEEEKQGFFTNIKNKVSPKTKRRVVLGTIYATAAVVGIAIGNWAFNRFMSPTATGSKIASTIDTPDLDGIDDTLKDTIEEPVEEVVTETQVVETSTNTSSNSSRNYSSNYHSNSSSNNTTSTPGSVNDSALEFQDPSASIDDSNNNNNQPDSGDDSYNNVIEGETPNDNETEGDVPIDDDTNLPDDDYSEIIDVPAKEEPEEQPGDDNQNQDEEDEDLTLGDIVLDDEFIGNEGSIDGDLSYEYDVEYVESPEGLEEYIESEPTTDNNNLTNEENLNNQISEPVEDIEVVPVEQEEPAEITTVEEPNLSSLPSPEITASDGNYVSYENEQLVNQAVEAMANGEDVNLVYDANTGSITLEQNTATVTNSEAMVK